MTTIISVSITDTDYAFIKEQGYSPSRLLQKAIKNLKDKQ